jgi:hypothetical protein
MPEQWRLIMRYWAACRLTVDVCAFIYFSLYTIGYRENLDFAFKFKTRGKILSDSYVHNFKDNIFQRNVEIDRKGYFTRVPKDTGGFNSH